MIKKIFNSTRNFVKKHKIVSAFSAIIIIIGIYLIFSSFKGGQASISYAVAAVEKGTIISSISGSGQVSVSEQIDIKPKASGDIIYLNIKQGDEVKSGALLVQIDSSDAQKTVRDAEISLESARLSLEKLQEPVDELSLLQAENSLLNAETSKQNTEDNLEKAYEDGFNAVSNAFLDLPTIMTGLNNILFGISYNTNQSNLYYYSDMVKQYDDSAEQIREDADNSYQAARIKYNENFDDYKAISRSSSTNTIVSLIDETYETAKSISESIKDAINLIQFYKDKLTERNLRTQPLADAHLTTLDGYTGTTNGFLSNLLSAKTTIENAKESILSAQRSIKEKTISLANLKEGADPLDIRSQKITVAQKEDALLDAKQKLADYSIRAPIDGIIAEVNSKKGDSISSGTVIAALITKQLVAEIPLNEVDVAKLKVGQKATLTFDAIDGLSITGKIIEIDSLGTATQGVVTYNVKIGFDTQDERVKPGMSTSAVIIIDVKQNVLSILNSAIKQQGNISYVEIINDNISLTSNAANIKSVMLTNPLQMQTVQVGIANDTMTEIISGLKEGDKVVTQTISVSSAQNQIQQSNGFRIPGITGGASGGFRRD